MKKLIFPISIVLSLFFTQETVLAQTPEAINYQAIARNLAGNPLISTPVNLQFEILQGSATGVVAYSETQALTTNQFGLFTAQIGSGAVVSGVFSNILWGSNPYYLRVTVNGDIMTATQLLSVPYALYAKASAGGPQGVPGINCWDTNGNGIQDPAEDINGDLLWNALDCQGDTGVAGTNGVGVNWLGSFNTAPAGSLNDAYYNSIDGISYIFNGTTLSWDTLASSGGSTPDGDWIIAGNNMSSGITGNVGIGTLIPNKKLSIRSASATGDGISINNIGTGDPGLQFETQGTPYFVLGIDQSDNNKFKIGTSGVNTNPRFTINGVGNIGIGTTTPVSKLQVVGKTTTDSLRVNIGAGTFGNVLTDDGTGNAIWQTPGGAGLWQPNTPDIYFNTGDVGIGTANPLYKFSVLSPDSMIATFTSTNANFGAIALSNINNTDVGFVMLSGADTALFGYTPAQKLLVINNSKIGGHIALNSDSSVISYAQVVGASASGKIYNKTPAIYNEVDSIYSYSSTGTILNVNQGMFYTDSLYVLGNNSFMPNWVLANDGTGQAKWTNPSLLGGSSLWQQNSPNIYFNTGNVGIGTISPGALLDVNGTFKLTDGTQGLSKVLTSDAFGNATWQVPAAATSGWSLTGNAGTSPITNFIGTTDNQPLIFKTNNVFSGKIDPSSYASFFGYSAGNNTMTGISNTAIGAYTLYQHISGSNNTAIGAYALNNDTTGADNTATGAYALFTNTTGFANTATGDNALGLNTTGYRNTANGNSALSNNTIGYNNTAIGWNALFTNTTGNFNTAIGYNAGVTTGGLTNATAIGYQAKVAASNSMVLGGTGAYAVNVGIGITAPTSKLQIVGTTTTDALRVTTTPVTGYVLTSDAFGNATWQAPTTSASLWTSTFNNIYPSNILDSVGIGTSTPLAKLHVANGGIIADWTNTGGVDPNLTVINVNGGSPGYSGGTLGQVTIVASPTTENKYAIQGIAGGINGDKYGLYGGASGPGLTNYGLYGSASGATSNWAGYFAAGNVYIQDTLFMPSGAVAGNVLTSDATGKATWQVPSGGSLWTQNGSAINYMTGRVGIGIAAPVSSFNIIYTGADGEASLVNYTNNTAAGIGTGYYVGANNTGTGPITAGGFQVNASANASKTVVLNASNISTSGNNFGVVSKVTGVVGGASKNLAGYFEASGATSNYALQLVDGSQGAGKILTSDAVGAASWKTNQIAFEAFTTGTQTLNTTPTKVLFNNISFNDGSGFISGANEFVAPINGVYAFQMNVNYTVVSVDDLSLDLIVNNGVATIIKTIKQKVTNNNSNNNTSYSITLKINAGDKVYFQAFSTFGGSVTLNSTNTWFSGHLVYAY